VRRDLNGVVFSSPATCPLEKFDPFLTENAHPDGLEKVKGGLMDRLDLPFAPQSILGTTLEI
jgi:hypothetical protein